MVSCKIREAVSDTCNQKKILGVEAGGDDTDHVRDKSKNSMRMTRKCVFYNERLQEFD